jgi:hypothetical protein
VSPHSDVFAAYIGDNQTRGLPQQALNFGGSYRLAAVQRIDFYGVPAAILVRRSALLSTISVRRLRSSEFGGSPAGFNGRRLGSSTYSGRPLR